MDCPFDIGPLLALAVVIAFSGVSPARAQSPPEQVDAYIGGQDGYHTYRIPALVVTPKGTLLAFCEGRKNSPSDFGDIDLMLKRSTDGGRTWSQQVIVYEEGGGAEITIGNPCPVVDQNTGIVHLLCSRNNGHAFHMSSQDDGLTWSAPEDITEVFRTFDFIWTRLATGPGHGIQLQFGQHKGRLIVPIWLNERIHVNYRSGLIYSDDSGRTWHRGSLAGAEVKDTNECMVFETSDGTLGITMRAQGTKCRTMAWSRDGGVTWSPPQPVEVLIDPVCQASILAWSAQTLGGKRLVVFANPASDKRENLTVRLSYDEGKSWPVSRVLWPGPSGYSDCALIDQGTIGCLYERGEQNYREKITFARINLDWLTAGA